MISNESAESVDVSVIIPMYNAEENVSRCLEEVLGQTLRNLEVICVDDGSIDGTADLLDQWAARDSRIKVLHQENGGAGAARNAGLAIARGVYLSFLDVDDRFRSSMLERAYSVAREADLDVVVFRADHFYPEEGRYDSIPWSITERLLPSKRPFAGLDVERDVFKLFVGWAWDKLFKASFVKDNGLRFQEIRTTNDLLFTFSSVVKAERIDVIHDVLVHHVKSSGTLSVTREKSWNCFYRALCALRDQLKSWGLYERFERDYLNYCIHAILWNVSTLAEPTRAKLIEMLSSDWVEDLGIMGHGDSFYYHKKEYEQLRQLLRQ